jgi:hypothetical protein
MNTIAFVYTISGAFILLWSLIRFHEVSLP